MLRLESWAMVAGIGPVRYGSFRRIRVWREGRRAMEAGIWPERLVEKMEMEVTRLVVRSQPTPYHSQQSVVMAGFHEGKDGFGSLKEFLIRRRIFLSVGWQRGVEEREWVGRERKRRRDRARVGRRVLRVGVLLVFIFPFGVLSFPGWFINWIR
ncbi:hypothetical protein RHMOL_Rhmol03G0011200 [Rhododendron molle]|uniref:Uncharacterized protein n=1 Tax=Rhododendron molle TaxID=49168 RepID=A0ACC0P9F1_RHOML|nr:hypothetical protein RHMOL_Rhmol03G0011200 [Rhododendron molle]